MKPLGLSRNRLAIALGVPAQRIGQIVKGKRAITTDTALRLAACFGTTPQLWLNLQTEYDLRRAKRDRLAEAIRAEVRPLNVAQA